MIVAVDKSNERAWAKLWSDFSHELWPSDPTPASHYLQERGKTYYHNEFLYHANNEYEAFLSLSLRHDYVEGTKSSPVGYIEGIYVSPNFRNKGIAQELINFAKKWARDNNCSQLASDCELGNLASEAFHKSIGFKEANRIICFTMDI